MIYTWHIYGTLTGTTTSGQSRPGSNDNEGVLHIPQSSRTRASSSDAVYCHIQDTSSVWLIDGILTGTTTPSKSGPWNNDNEGVLHIPQSSRTGASPSVAVYCHIQESSSIWLIDGILTGTTSPGQSRPGSNDNEGVRHMRHFSLSFIASGRSSGLHSVSSHSCCYVCSSWSSCFCPAICGGP